MLNAAATITYTDGTSHVVERIGQPDLIAFERRFDKPSSAFADENNTRLEWISFLFWNALRRTQQITQDFDTWLDKVAAMEVGEGKDQPSTDPEPSTT
jgi:hypothetical protein